MDQIWIDHVEKEGEESGRIRILRVSPLQLLRKLSETVTRAAVIQLPLDELDLPSDTRVVGLHPYGAGRAIDFLIWSREFELLKCGQEAPRHPLIMNQEFRSVDLSFQAERAEILDALFTLQDIDSEKAQTLRYRNAISRIGKALEKMEYSAHG